MVWARVPLPQIELLLQPLFLCLKLRLEKKMVTNIVKYPVLLFKNITIKPMSIKVTVGLHPRRIAPTQNCTLEIKNVFMMLILG